MKRRVSIIVLALIILSVMPVLATTNESVDIDLYIDSQGSGHFTTTYVYDDDQGTEHYIPINLEEPKRLENFTVSRNGEDMIYEPNWDIGWTLEQKAGKYGLINTPTGYEMTYGITEYGLNTFVLSYTIDNLITTLNDYDMLYHQFLNPDLSEKPGSIKITIHSDEPFTEENVRYWSFGLDSNNYLSDGKIIIESVPDFRYQYAIGLTRFPLGTFMSEDIRDETFDYYREWAFEGSEYDITASTEIEDQEDYQPLSFYSIFIGIMAFVTVFGGFLGLLLKSESKETNLKVPKDIRPKEYYYRDPMDMTIDKFFYILLSTGDTSYENYITAYFLKWIYEGRIEPTTEEKGFLFKKQATNLKIIDKDKPAESEAERRLLQIVLDAAGTNDILEEKEMTKYINRYPKKLEGFYNTLKNPSREYLVKEDYIDISIKKVLFIKTKEEILSSKGVELTKNLLGLKAYLEDYSLLSERESVNVHLWDYYMIYAGLFGIAEKVQKEFSKLYPQYIEQSVYDPRAIYWTSYYAGNMNRTYQSAIRPASSPGASGGFGGGGSFGGGGGGFSGGGSGGGTR